MPIYDYECGSCGEEFEALQAIADRKTASCVECGSIAKLFFKPGFAPGVSSFKAGWWRDIESQPLYISSPQELRDACDRNNSISHFLEDGIHKTSPGPDPEHL